MKNKLASFALPVLFAGAVGIAFAPIFVRLSETGPVTTAFYRLLFSVPLLWLWTLLDAKYASRNEREIPKKPRSRYEWKWICLAGLFFAGDLSVWHWSITFTTVANATLFANFAPIFVTFGAWLLFRERITFMFLAGLALALCGAALLIGISFGEGDKQVLGDALGLLTAVFYAGYILSIKRVRSMFSTPVTMTWSGIITCIALFVIAVLTEDKLAATTLFGWGVLLGLALIAHTGGQAMIAYSLAHLPASFASVGLLLQPAGAAFLAWIILGETLGIFQGLGGLLILTGIFLAWRASLTRGIKKT